MDQDALHRRIEANETHKKLTAWVDHEMAAGRMTKGDKLWNASRDMLNSLWHAAHNDYPKQCMNEKFEEDAAAFDKARREANRLRDDGTVSPHQN